MISKDEAWIAVMGERSPGRVVFEFELEGTDPASMREWVSEAVVEAERQGLDPEVVTYATISEWADLLVDAVAANQAL